MTLDDCNVIVDAAKEPLLTEIERLLTENERLRAENDRLRERMQQIAITCAPTINAENKRLRALISDMMPGLDEGPIGRGLIDRARRALGDEAP